MKKEAKPTPKAVNKKVLMNRRASTVLGKEVKIRGANNRLKMGVITGISDTTLRVRDRKGVTAELPWGEVLNAD